MLLGNLLFRTAQLHGDGPAFAGCAQMWHWEESLQRIRRLASGLLAARPGRVAILAHNSVAYLELSFALPMAGIPMVPLNTRLAAPELRQLIADANPGLLIADGAHAELARALADEQGCELLLVEDENSASWQALMADTPADPVPTDEREDWAIIYTGGTTGLPKGVRVTRAGFGFNLQHILRDLDWGPRPRFLQVTPLFHLAALGPGFAVAAWGGCQHLLPQFSIDGLVDALERHRIEATALVPTMITWLVGRDDLGSRDLSTLRAIGYGASAIPEAVLRRALERFPGLRFNQFYGQTEASGGLATLRATDHDLAHPTRLRAAGQPVVGVRLAILDEQGGEVPRGTWGEVCAQTPGLFAGYLNNPEATAFATRDGWLHTGDVGFIDEEGYLHITDRLKDMIVTGGENVSSSEVESAILRHDAVREAAVVAAPDPEWGERVHAFVSLKPGAALDHAALVAHCRTLIAGYKCPRSSDISETPLPLSAVGKIRKDLLRARARGEGDAAVG
ncbi:class I adenylate-forming enzyme family protein [Sandaracinobacteroides saxicola]|uniref:AMP-binding protein n=1 Tax=Sandaracinobacteroides saxicola TaxID=2759707 RepID=A0A7G5ILF5_9SPHN|nr:AMP-binding protein [Sandaracinobacteroides saxicola]QMW24197.1 AMP-binding protein [Sandaracinobacteroides saxicola]